MKRTAAIAFIVSLLLWSCNQNKPTAAQIPVVGEAVDSVAIAQDTIQQTTLEESYEYAQTVVVSPKLVYDIRAYGGPPSHGEYCIIRRGADNKPDTVFQAERFGIIINAFTADLNQNGKEEVYVVMKNTNPESPNGVAGFEFDKTGKADVIKYEDYLSPSFKEEINYSSSHKVDDSVYIKDNSLIVSFPHSKNGLKNYAFKLKGNRLTEIKNN